MKSLTDLHRAVWEFRGIVHDRWPTPAPIDALRFAVTEMGEVMDAYLRQDKKWVRNNHRNTDIDAELGDLAVMLFTAVPESMGKELSSTSEYIDGKLNIDKLSLAVASALVFCSPDVIPINSITIALIGVSQLTNLEESVINCLDRLAKKHGVSVEVKHER